MPIELDGTRERAVSYHKQALYAVVVVAVVATLGFVVPWNGTAPIEMPDCLQPAIIQPTPGLYSNTTQFLSAEYEDISVNLLGGAIQIPTESYDDMLIDPNQDPRFEPFLTFHAYLNRNFPKTSKYVETVNTYGLLYTIPGSDSSLKPVILMAHQDVVPVNPSTVSQWTHPPYSGFFDGEYIWGRGAADTKNSLVAILEATESLLGQGWKPTRDILISFGFDEELDGSRGAQTLADEILSRYGPDSVHFIVDEGSGLSFDHGALFALPSVAEKGYTDIQFIVETPGGHSSMPPDHSGIGIAAEVVTQIEDIDLFQPNIDEANPLIAQLGCYAAHAPLLDAETRRKWAAISSSSRARYALAQEFSQDRQQKTFVSTTQAVDMVKGGVKVNALPEIVEVTTNYRINVESSVGAVTDRFARIAKAVAESYDMGLKKNNETILTETTNGVLHVINGQSIEPVKSSPSSGPVWDLLGGTTRHVFEDILGRGPLYFSPTLSTGNTDTTHYLQLTRNVYRYTPILDEGNAHTVDEYVSISDHISVVMWYYELLQLID